MWNRFLKNYFTFTRRERNGLIVLLLMMLVVIFWPAVTLWLYKDPPTDFSAFRREIDSFNAVANKTEAGGDEPQQSLSELDSENGASKAESIVLFAFDPNTIDENGWKKLGLRAKTVQTIMKYRAGGGKFFKDEDLKKIYGLKPSEYERLVPYIQIATASRPPNKPYQSFNSETKHADKSLVELNTADSLSLDALHGIGAVLSSRIIKFRDRLGGFVSIDQLKDVYGLSPETLDELKKQVSVDSSKIIKLDINTIDAASLSRHPYFKNPIAKTIISYRDQHGRFESSEDIKNVDLVTDDLYQKVIPYLKF
jgi:DNA uptake protein ComE-like DNA-binding protein